MAEYMVECRSCGFRTSITGTIKDYENYVEGRCEKCGNYELRRVFDDGGSVAFLDPHKAGIKKPDREFRNLLNTIKSRNHGRGNIERFAE